MLPEIIDPGVPIDTSAIETPPSVTARAVCADADHNFVELTRDRTYGEKARLFCTRCGTVRDVS
jgi:hypothetical protein